MDKKVFATSLSCITLYCSTIQSTIKESKSSPPRKNNERKKREGDRKKEREREKERERKRERVR